MNRYLAYRVRAETGTVLRRSGSHARAGAGRVPDNSEPWLAVPPQTLADVFSISDQIQNMVAEWTRRLQHS